MKGRMVEVVVVVVVAVVVVIGGEGEEQEIEGVSEVHVTSKEEDGRVGPVEEGQGSCRVGVSC